MNTGTFSINWTLQEGQCQLLTSPQDGSLELPSSPGIYSKDESDNRCMLDIHVPQDHQAVLVSNAKACEVHEICEGQRQEYQGSCRATQYGTGMWQLTMSAQAEPRSLRLVMCALASPEQLTLWRVMFEPSKAACRHQEASRESMSSMSQMTSIRQMLQQSTLEDLQQTCDPKRRFMHALATAALQQGDGQVSADACQPAERLNRVVQSNGEQTGGRAASASSGDTAGRSRLRPQSTAALQGLSDERDTDSFEPVQQARANVELDQFERDLDRIFKKQLRKFEHKLSSICDVALARFQEHMNEAMHPREPDSWKSVNRA